jgi:23S rRNA (pseudouridine1915-N3)-methyltransferase
VRLTVIAVGRLKKGPEKELAEDYLKRAEGLGRQAGIRSITVKEFAESQQATASQRMAEEGQEVARALPPGAFTVVLDERGKGMTSEAFAALLRRHLDGGSQDVAFILGGPDGHGPEIRENAGLLLSFGTMTWPHRLARVMLLEQIYRAVTIMVNHPYHRP